jgi:hypothetical protein
VAGSTSAVPSPPALVMFCSESWVVGAKGGEVEGMGGAAMSRGGVVMPGSVPTGPAGVSHQAGIV